MMSRGRNMMVVMKRARFKRTPQFTIFPAPADYDIRVSSAELSPRIIENPIK